MNRNVRTKYKEDLQIEQNSKYAKDNPRENMHTIPAHLTLRQFWETEFKLLIF
jgi:hypothetical protein